MQSEKRHISTSKITEAIISGLIIVVVLKFMTLNVLEKRIENIETQVNKIYCDIYKPYIRAAKNNVEQE